MKIGSLGLKRKELAEWFIEFCLTYNLFTESEMMSITCEAITNQMEYSWGVEWLIKTLITRASNIEIIDLEVLRNLLVELQELKLSLDNTEQ